MLIKLRSKSPILQNLRLHKHSYVVNTVEHPVSDYPKCEELVVAYGGRQGVVVYDNRLARVARVSVWFRSKERGTRVKDRAENGASKRAGKG